MKRAYRLQRPEQFERVRRKGKTVSHPMLRLNVAPNHHRRTRFGFVVSKSVGTAVKRNRARRRLREAVRLVLPHIASGVDVVCVVRTNAIAELPFANLLHLVEELFRRAGIWVD